VTLIEKIYNEGKIPLDRGDHPNPLLVELASAAERALNYMHTGNTAVIATSVMNPLWIGRSIVRDGCPCLNPKIVSASSNTRITFCERKWPWDDVKHKPKTSSDRAQILMYDANHFNVSDISFGNLPSYVPPRIECCLSAAPCISCFMKGSKTRG
jgi:hypothetical protein